MEAFYMLRFDEFYWWRLLLKRRARSLGVSHLLMSSSVCDVSKARAVASAALLLFSVVLTASSVSCDDEKSDFIVDAAANIDAANAKDSQAAADSSVVVADSMAKSDATEDTFGDASPSPSELSFYGIDNANRLVRFSFSSINSVTALELVGLEPGETVVGLDFRGSDGVLIALGSSSRIYSVNKNTGALTQMGGRLATLLAGTAFGFDHNHTIDRLRIHSDKGANVRLNPATAAIAPMDLPLQYAAGDVGGSAIPSITASAYAWGSDATTAVLYAIDTALDRLVLVNPPNNGICNTIGPLGVNANSDNGFDIPPGPNPTVGYFATTIANGVVSNLYRVSLQTGAFTLVGPIGGSPLRALTIER